MLELLTLTSLHNLPIKSEATFGKPTCLVQTRAKHANEFGPSCLFLSSVLVLRHSAVPLLLSKGSCHPMVTDA